MTIRCLAIEIGNTRGKSALYELIAASSLRGTALPTPLSPIFAWNVGDPIPWTALEQQSGGDVDVVAIAGSRPRDVAELADKWPRLTPAPLQKARLCAVRGYRETDMVLGVEAPERVGIDRLLSARAAFSCSAALTKLIVVSVGTATTVDLVTADGVYRGGAILPGIDLGGRALHDHTQALPLVQPGRTGTTDEVLPTGSNTIHAITSGLVWGHVGAIRELVVRQAETAGGGIELWLTGGAAPLVADRLRAPFAEPWDKPFSRLRHVPYLTLAGLGLIAAENV